MTASRLCRAALLLVGVFLTAADARAACLAPPSGLVGWWRAENNGKDTVNGNHGSTGFTGYAAGKVGQAFSFSAPQGVSVAGNSIHNMQSPGFTAEFWMRGIKNQPGSLAILFEKGLISNSGWAVQVENSSGFPRFSVGNGSGYTEIFSSLDILDNALHHVAGTWDGTTMRLYVDGVLQGSAAVTPATNGFGVNIGTWVNGSSRAYNGLVDEASIYNRELSLAEIQAIITASTDGKCSPCGDGIQNTDEDCDDGNLVNGDCCSDTCHAETPGNPCASDGESCTTDVCSGMGRCIHIGDGSCPCVAPPSGITAWWRAENNGKDTVNGNHVTTGSTGYAAGKVGQAFSFTAPQGVTVPSNALHNITAPGWTAEFWMKGIKNQNSLAVLVEKSHISNSGWVFQVQNSNGVVSLAVGNGSGFPGVNSNGDVLDNVLHHIAGTWDGTTIRLYVDGILQGSTGLTTPAVNGFGLNIGTWVNGSSRAYTGLVDEVSIYNRALSPAEIQSILTAGPNGKCSPCGDGDVDYDETCDDGNLVSGDCCSSTCLPETAGNPCATDSNVCTDDECDGAGACAHLANTDPCDDGLYCNGTDVCDSGACDHSGSPCGMLGECADACNETADTCDAEPAGTACTADGNVCTDDECDGAGSCGVNNTDPCDDADVCTVGDACSGGTCIPGGSALDCDDANLCTSDSCDPIDGCVHAEEPVDAGSCLLPLLSKLQIVDSADDTKDKLQWQFGKGEAFAQTLVGEPTMDTTYALCVYDATATVPSLVASIHVPASSTLWRDVDPKGAIYLDKEATVGGTRKLQIKTGDSGKTKVKFQAGGASLVLPGPAGATYFNQAPAVVAQLVNDVGACWTTEFAPASTILNDTDAFKAQVK